MTTKPDLTRVWAEGAPVANVEDPDVTTPGKYNAGWVAEIPPFENFNFLQQQFSQGLAHANEFGVMQWDADTEFPLGGWSRSTVDNEVYVSLVPANQNNEPSASPSEWTLLGLLTLAKEINLKSSRKNFILNGDGRIDQVLGGALHSPGSGVQYTLDQIFMNGGGLVTHQQISNAGVDGVSSGFEIIDSGSATSAVLWGQVMKANSAFNNKNLVVSLEIESVASTDVDILVRYQDGSSGGNTVTLLNQNINIDSGYEKLSFVVPAGSPTGNGNIAVNLVKTGTTANTTIRMTKVQLENSPFATDFEHREESEELSLCQAFFYNHSESFRTSPYGTSSFSSTFAREVIQFPVQMDSVPVITLGTLTSGTGPQTARIWEGGVEVIASPNSSINPPAFANLTANARL